MEPNTVLDTRLDEGAFVTHSMEHIEAYAADHDAIGTTATAEWAADLRERDDAGETFFSYTQYCYLIHKPG